MKLNREVSKSGVGAKAIVVFLNYIVVSIIAAPVIGGFAFGFVHAEGCGWNLACIPGRIAIGAIFAFLTPITLGFPPVDGTGAEFYNTWPYVGTVLALLTPLSLLGAYAELKSDLEPGGSPGDGVADTSSTNPKE